MNCYFVAQKIQSMEQILERCRWQEQVQKTISANMLKRERKQNAGIRSRQPKASVQTPGAFLASQTQGPRYVHIIQGDCYGGTDTLHK